MNDQSFTDRTLTQGVRLMDLDDVGILPTILTYLPFNDLNTLAVCCRRLHSLRASDELDQTRSGTLEFVHHQQQQSSSSGDALVRLVHAVVTSCNPRSIFTGNRTNLRLVGFVENLTDDALQVNLVNTSASGNAAVLWGVASLDLTHEKRPKDLQIAVITRTYLNILGGMLPNLQVLDISYSEEITGLVSRIKSAFPKLYSLSANYTAVKVLLERWTLRQWTSLKELNIQGQQGFHAEDMRHGLPPNLERLDIYKARDANQLAIPTRELLDIIRGMPCLRWLRCEVSNADRLLLLTECPNVTVVNH